MNRSRQQTLSASFFCLTLWWGSAEQSCCFYSLHTFMMHLESVIWSNKELQFKDHLQATSRRLSPVGLPLLLLCKSDHVRKKWKQPEGWMPSLFPLSVTSSRLSFPLMTARRPDVCAAPGCLGLVCYDINFKCLLALKATQQIHGVQVTGPFYSTGLRNRSDRLPRKWNTLRLRWARDVRICRKRQRKQKFRDVQEVKTQSALKGSFRLLFRFHRERKPEQAADEWRTNVCRRVTVGLRREKQKTSSTTEFCRKVCSFPPFCVLKKFIVQMFSHACKGDPKKIL